MKTIELKRTLFFVGIALFLAQASVAQVKQIKKELPQKQVNTEKLKVLTPKVVTPERIRIPKLIDTGHGLVFERPGNSNPSSFYESMTSAEKENYSSVIKKWKPENEPAMYSTLADAKAAISGNYRIARQSDVEALLKLPMMKGTKNGKKGIWFAPSEEVMGAFISNKSSDAVKYCLFLPFAGWESYGNNNMEGVDAYYLLDNPSPNNNQSLVCLWISESRVELWYCIGDKNHKYPVRLVSK